MTKKIIALIFVFMFLTSTSVLALGNMEGSQWKTLSNKEKEVYAKGLLDGINLGIVAMMANIGGDDMKTVAKEMKEEGQLLIPENPEEDINKVINNVNEKIKNDQTLFELFVEENLGEELK